MRTSNGFPLRNAVLLVHDVVRALVERNDTSVSAVIENIQALIEASRAASLPVIFVAPGPGKTIATPPPESWPKDFMVWGTRAVDIPESMHVLPQDTIVRKPRYGAFFGTGLAEELRQAQRGTLIICGISLTGGVEMTVREAFNYDFCSILVQDACLCRPIADEGWGAVSAGDVAKVTLSVLAQRFARVLTTADVCAELQTAVSSGSPT